MRWRGFSLVECLVTSFVLVVLISPLVTLGFQSRLQAQSSFDEIRAAFLAREALDLLQTNFRIQGWVSLDSLLEDKEYVRKQVKIMKSYQVGMGDELRTNSYQRLDSLVLPHNFQRTIRLEPAGLYLPSGVDSSDLQLLTVRVQWMSGGTTYNRSLEICTLLAPDRYDLHSK